MKKFIFLLCFTALVCFFLCGSSAPYIKKPLTIVADGETLFQGEIRIAPERAARAERSGGYAALYATLRAKYDARESLNYLSKGLGDYARSIGERKAIDPLSATLEWTKDLSSPFIYYEGREGRVLSEDAIGRAVCRALDEGSVARVFSEPIAPSVGVADLKARTREMGRFTTYFYSSGENRRRNLRIAAESISGKILQAGETFSFNETVGARTTERGFCEANIVVNGSFVKGIGGGVCQISTTLYNAVLLSSLPVGNAAAHSCPVSYVPYSRDCTVSSVIDFTFTNDTPYPLYILSEIKGSAVTIALFGEKKRGNVSLQSEVTERVPYRLRSENGALCLAADAEILSPGREGIKSKLYLIRTIDGVTTKTLVRENYYPPKDAVCKSKSRAICNERRNARSLTPW